VTAADSLPPAGIPLAIPAGVLPPPAGPATAPLHSAVAESTCFEGLRSPTQAPTGFDSGVNLVASSATWNVVSLAGYRAVPGMYEIPVVVGFCSERETSAWAFSAKRGISQP